MTGRVALLLFCLSAGCYAVSALFKFQHWPFAGPIRLLALAGLVISLILFIIAVVRNRGIYGLLDGHRENDEGGK